VIKKTLHKNLRKDCPREFKVRAWKSQICNFSNKRHNYGTMEEIITTVEFDYCGKKNIV
jgi:hypothetical protein